MSTALALPGWGTAPARMDPLCAALREQGIDATPWAYDARGSIERIGQRLADHVARIDGEVHLVGHSLGGLAVASAVLDAGAEVTSVTTVNSPWRGTWAAWTADADDPLGRQLRWGADRLSTLRDALALHLEATAGPRWTVASAALDLAAPPTTALRVPDGSRMTRLLVPVSGHSISLEHPRFIERIVDAIACVPVG